MTNRTDLAIEFQKHEKNTQIERKKIGNFEVFLSTICEDNPYNRKAGDYATINVGKIDLITDFEDIEKAIFYCLKKLIKRRPQNVLVVGLGNREIISDSIGPFTCEKILATRHIAGEFAEKIGLKNLKSVAVLSPNVLGKTGLESAETVSCVVEKIKPDLVLVIDALCANNTENLFSVIQLTNSGISPGSGVKNARKELSKQTLGVPTIAIGIPTVVEAKTIAEELSKTKISDPYDLLLTPKETDLLSHRMSEILSHSLNLFLQPETDREIILSLV